MTYLIEEETRLISLFAGPLMGKEDFPSYLLRISSPDQEEADVGDGFFRKYLDNGMKMLIVGGINGLQWVLQRRL
jgi:hypothetical protein